MSVQKSMAPSHRQPLNRQGVLRISGETLRIGTINVGTMRERSEEVAEMLERRRVDICALQEVRMGEKGAKILNGKDSRYKIWWNGDSGVIGGVAVMIHESWVNNVIETVRKDCEIMKVKLVCGKRIVHFFSVYSPQQGRQNEEKEEIR